MSNSTATSLLVVAIVAVAAPVLSEVLRRLRIPSVLFELGLGIIVGPAVLGLAEAAPFIDGLSTLGLAFLFFIAGYELDFNRIKGGPLRRAGVSWTVTVVVALTTASVMVLTGFVLSELLIGLALTTTAIGTLMPMLRDRGLIETDFGAEMLAAGAVGEFGPVVAVTLFLGTSSPTVEGLVLIGFVLVALGLARLAARPKPPRIIEALSRNLETSSQLPVRVVMLLVTVMVLMATFLSIDMLLGAFAAGLIGRLLFPPDESTRLMAKVESIGYGFLIPVFFIVSGMKFDLDALTSDPMTLARVPLFLGLFLLLRGAPALLVYRGELGVRQRSALAVLQSTALPLLVVITEIGLATGHMKPANAAAIVGAGMLSVLIFPLVGFGLLGEPAPATDPTRATEPRQGPQQVDPDSYRR